MHCAVGGLNSYGSELLTQFLTTNMANQSAYREAFHTNHHYFPPRFNNGIETHENFMFFFPSEKSTLDLDYLLTIC